MKMISDYWLLLANVYLAILVLGIGIIFSKRPIPFVRILIVLLFSMIVNKWLKQLFHVPLAAHLGSGFALPSGHMQSALVFWGAAAIEYRQRWFSWLALVILIGIGYLLMLRGFHTAIDVLAAVISGSALLLIVYVALFPRSKFMAFRFGLFILTLIAAILFVQIHGNFNYLWGALGFLLGLTLALNPNIYQRYEPIRILSK